MQCAQIGTEKRIPSLSWGNIHLFSEAGQWKWPLSCHLGTDKTQLEASQSRKRGLGSQGRSVVMASLLDLQRRKKSISSNSPSKSCIWVLCSFGTDPFSSPAKLCRACLGYTGDLAHTPFIRQFRWPAALKEPGNSKMGFLRASRASCGLRSRLPDNPGGPSGFFLLYSRHLSA